MKPNYDGQTDGWLMDIAKALPASSGFEERCVSAALDAFEITKLRIAREKYGFVPITIEQYVQGLAKRAGVELERIMRWAQLANFHANVETAENLGRLIHVIGAQVHEAKMLARMSWADQLGFGPVPMLVSFRGSSRGGSEFEIYEDALQTAEAEYRDPDKVALGRILALIVTAYPVAGASL